MIHFPEILILTILFFNNSKEVHLTKEIHLGENILDSYVVRNEEGRLFIIISHPYILECLDTSGEKKWSIYNAYSRLIFYPRDSVAINYIIAVRSLSKATKTLLVIRLRDGKIVDTTVINSKYEDPHIVMDNNLVFLITLYRTIKDTPRYYFGKLTKKGKIRQIKLSNIGAGSDSKILFYKDDLVLFGIYSSLTFSYTKDACISDLHTGLLVASIMTGKILNRYILGFNNFSHIEILEHSSNYALLSFFGHYVNPESYFGLKILSLPSCNQIRSIDFKGNYYSSYRLLDDSLIPFFNPDSNNLMFINKKNFTVWKYIKLDSLSIFNRIPNSNYTKIFVNNIDSDNYDDLVIVKLSTKISYDPRWLQTTDKRGRFGYHVTIYILVGPTFEKIRKITLGYMPLVEAYMLYGTPLIFLKSNRGGYLKIIDLSKNHD